MKRPAFQAFTLIELLVVIGIIAVIASISLPILSNVMLAGRRTQSLSNMRQWGIMFISYCGDNNGQVPGQGTKNPSWGDTSSTGWYNVLPRTYGGARGAGDYASGASAADFYKKGSLFYVPAAKYPATKLNVPMFAFTYCSKLIDSTYEGGDSSVVRLQNFQSPANTCVFQESGVTGETNIRGQNAYNTEIGNNQCYTFASRTVARYQGQTIIVFADGHSALVTGTEIVAPSGKSYIPQIGTTTSPTGVKSWMSWTPNPANDATQ